MANVVRTFQGDLCRKINEFPNELLPLALDFQGKGIIGRHESKKVKEKQGMDGIVLLLDYVCDKIDKTNSDCLKTVFQVLEKQEFLSDIVKEMKEGLYDLAISNFTGHSPLFTAHSPTPTLAQCSLRGMIYLTLVTI